jgi:hypothetical protein
VATEPDLPPQWPAASPVTRTDGTERRANSRALEYWKERAGSRRFPSRADITSDSAGDLWGHLFIVEVAADPTQYRYVMAGDVLRQALGRDPTGEAVTTALPGGMGVRSQFFQQAAVGLKQPVMDDVGLWARDDGTTILYRSILLPLSDDGEKVNFLLGAFSFRAVS